MDQEKILIFLACVKCLINSAYLFLLINILADPSLSLVSCPLINVIMSNEGCGVEAILTASQSVSKALEESCY
jgi:hypothetical protein